VVDECRSMDYQTSRSRGKELEISGESEFASPASRSDIQVIATISIMLAPAFALLSTSSLV
jgi:hypothetical protein